MFKKIGIIGLGFVGSAVESWLEKEGKYELKRFDTHKEIGSLEEVLEADLVFLCLPTPYGKDGYDDSALRETLPKLRDGQIVLIKSTVLPGSTERWQKEFSNLKILFNPEFLVQKTAKEDFLKPDRQIVGYTKESESVAQSVLDFLPQAPYMKLLPATEAEMVKYFANTFLSVRVIFANQMYDLCQKLGINYDAVKDGAGEDKRIGKSHFEVGHDGYRGYGGACLPKDTASLVDFAKAQGLEFSLLETVERINKRLGEED